MIRILGDIPRDITVACSGGPDSMAVIDFLANSHRDVKAVYFDHGTPHSSDAENLVRKYCEKKGIKLRVGRISRERQRDESPEEYWRNERYRFFDSINSSIVTAHNLNDVAEWWVMTSLHGEPRLIPFRRNNVIRPFLSTPKDEFVKWVTRKDVPFINDPSNENLKYSRCRVRHRVIPEILEVNPGFFKVVSKAVKKSFTEEKLQATHHPTHLSHG